MDINHELAIIERNANEQELLEDFNAIQMARPPEVLKRFVVGAQAKDHPAQGWAQAVLELQVKYDNIRRAKINAELIQIEIDSLEAENTPTSLLKAKLKRIDLEAQDRAMLGAIREFKTLYEIYKGFGRRYTREELNEAQAEYWQNRLSRQALQDQQSRELGIGAGNLEALREINISPMTLPAIPESVAKPIGYDIDSIVKIEDRFLSNTSNRISYAGNMSVKKDKPRILVVTLTASPTQPTTVPVLERAYVIPETVEYRLHCVYGMTIDRGYTEAVFQAVRDGATHLMCIEDDTFPPLDAIQRLLAHNKDIVCGWYPKRQPGPRVGVPIVLHEGNRQTLDYPDEYNDLVELYTAPMGCTLIDMNVFKRIEMPWFVTTAQLSQDSFFSQKARDAGFTLWCDPTIRCEHIDRDTGIIYK